MQSYNSFSDSELAVLLQSGDRLAFTYIYNKYFHTLYIHALQKLQNEGEAQDIVQELFAQLWLKHQELTIHSNLKAYLFTSIRNRILDYIAKQNVQERYLDSLAGFLDKHYSVTDHLVREKQLTEHIERCVSSLPSKMKEIFELSRKQALSHREIAKQLHISEQTVKKQVNNALRILRTKLGALLFL